jgi:hypothetical protein
MRRDRPGLSRSVGIGPAILSNDVVEYRKFGCMAAVADADIPQRAGRRKPGRVELVLRVALGIDDKDLARRLDHKSNIAGQRACCLTAKPQGSVRTLSDGIDGIDMVGLGNGGLPQTAVSIHGTSHGQNDCLSRGSCRSQYQIAEAISAPFGLIL